MPEGFDWSRRLGGGLVSAHILPLHVYYEDTDFTGMVYHANYLKFMERAREHALGIDELVRRWRESQVGFVVYQAQLTFKEAAKHGDALEVHTRWARQSRYRIVADQRVRRAGEERDMVIGRIELVPVDGNTGKLTNIPDDMLPILERYPLDLSGPVARK